MKVYYFVIIIVGLMLLLNLSGIATTTGYVLSKLGLVNNPENIKDSSFYITMYAIIAGVLVGGIAIGLLIQAALPFYAFAPAAALLLAFIGDMISVVKYANVPGYEWVKWIVSLVFLPLIIGYIISVYEWWRGTD